MDMPLEYNKHLHLDPGTKHLILELVKSLRSVVPVDPSTQLKSNMQPDSTSQMPPTSHEPSSGRQGSSRQPVSTRRLAAAEIKRNSHIENVLLTALQHSELLEGIIDPGELRRYYKYITDYGEIAEQIERLLSAVKSYQQSAAVFAEKLADLMKEHLEMAIPGDSEEEKTYSFPEYNKKNTRYMNDYSKMRVV